MVMEEASTSILSTQICKIVLTISSIEIQDEHVSNLTGHPVLLRGFQSLREEHNLAFGVISVVRMVLVEMVHGTGNVAAFMPTCTHHCQSSLASLAEPMAGYKEKTHAYPEFEEGGDGGGPSECDGKYHSDDDTIVALSTGWFNHQKRGKKYMKIHGNGKSVRAKVVGECDSTRGCAPCPYNIIDASKAIWKTLGVPESDLGEIDVYWSDSD
ncbi:putative ripening-related protein 1 [Hibiscus syriacus]|uniref:putative ripening-related protein 1 n=1 Tax=Hibiscus syriacus TaxID=106335 RepID=UPI00192278D0|nr:putative ripening-related protein 1 [Hibiscus syriacus]